MTNVAVLGVSGRMGRCLVRAIRESPDFVLSGALASPTSAALGRDAGEVAQTGPVAVEVTAARDIALANATIAIDFTLPEAVPENLAAVVRAGIPWVIGITGLDAARNAQIRKASERLPVLVPPTMTSRFSRHTIATRPMRPPARRCGSARSSREVAAARWPSRPSTGGLASRTAAAPAPSVSRACAAATSSANTMCCSQAPAKRSNSCTGPRTA